MSQTINKTHNRLLRKFHAILQRTGVGTDGKEWLLSNYGAVSAKELSTAQLAEACELLETAHKPGGEMDKLRKRVIAAVGAWLTAMNKQQNIALNKAIATRAAKRENFNDIPAGQLRSLYNAFVKAKKDLAHVGAITAQELFELTIYN
jgi:hypothetical protein